MTDRSSIGESEFCDEHTGVQDSHSPHLPPSFHVRHTPSHASGMSKGGKTIVQITVFCNTSATVLKDTLKTVSLKWVTNFQKKQDISAFLCLEAY